MIMGGSRIGFKTALRCEKKDRKKCEILSEKLEHSLVIHSNGRNSDLLKEEGIEGTDIFIAVTRNSETNILRKAIKLFCLHFQKQLIRLANTF